MMCNDWTTRYPVTPSCIGVVTALATAVCKCSAPCEPSALLDLRHVALRAADALDHGWRLERRRLDRLAWRRPRSPGRRRLVEDEREGVRDAAALVLVRADAGKHGVVERAARDAVRGELVHEVDDLRVRIQVTGLERKLDDRKPASRVEQHV